MLLFYGFSGNVAIQKVTIFIDNYIYYLIQNRANFTAIVNIKPVKLAVFESIGY